MALDYSYSRFGLTLSSSVVARTTDSFRSSLDSEDSNPVKADLLHVALMCPQLSYPCNPIQTLNSIQLASERRNKLKYATICHLIGFSSLNT